MATKPTLAGVTVCAADSEVPELSARALEISLDRCSFPDAVLFSHVPVAGRFRHVPIEPLKSLADYSRFCLRDLARHIRTPHVLVVQWDGYVVDASAWDRRYRNYDYVGAPIYPREGGAVVGNGGFSLRSRRLLKATAELPAVSGTNEDWVISHVFRTSLERDFGIRFAPLKVASRFSYEQRHLGRSTLGFHGQSNLWRHETDSDVIDVVRARPKSSLLSLNFFGLIVECLRNNRRTLAGALYAMLREDHETKAIFHAITAWVPAELTQQTIDALEPDYERGEVG